MNSLYIGLRDSLVRVKDDEPKISITKVQDSMFESMGIVQIIIFKLLIMELFIIDL